MGLLSGLLGGVLGAVTGPLGPALIGAASTLGGAAMSRPKNSYQVPDYVGIRRQAEAAGFNPLTALQFAPGQAVQSQNYMGQAIADAGMMLADSMAKNRASGQVSKLQQANATLAKKVQNLTLRPKVGGIYAQRQATPSLRRALGVSDASSTVGANAGVSAAPAADGGLRPLSDQLDVDPRRAVDNQDQKTTSGWMVVDNPDLPFNINVPTLDGDEALQWYDWPTLALAGGYAAAKHYANIFGSGDPDLAADISVNRTPRPTAEETAALKKRWPPRAPLYSGRGNWGMPRRRQTAMGWVPY